MGNEIDHREQIQRSGNIGASLPIAIRNQIAQQKANSANVTGSIDPVIDAQWAHYYTERPALHSYFDYYFTGQDLQVFIDGIERPDPEAELPMLGMAWKIEQQKVPVYGFWSYTFDNIMRGNRIVTGVFNIATTSTDYMTRMLSKAATARMDKNANYVIRGLDRDEELIDQYWQRNINDDTAYSNNKSIFSAHPPFNFVIVYGIQSSSITHSSSEKLKQTVSRYRTDTPLMTDINDRLVPTDPENAQRVVLENVEITGVEVQYAPDGSVLSEQYTFFARDMITPKLEYNNRTVRQTRVTP